MPQYGKDILKYFISTYVCRIVKRTNLRNKIALKFLSIDTSLYIYLLVRKKSRTNKQPWLCSEKDETPIFLNYLD